MSENSLPQSQQEIISPPENRLIHLPAPELIQVPATLRVLLGQEATQKQILVEFIESYWKLIENDLKSRFPNQEIGLRSVLGSNTSENLPVENLEQRQSVTAISKILKTGSDLKSLTTRITRLDKKNGDNPDTDMSKVYLRIMVGEALKSKIKEIIPLVLVYDLTTAKEVVGYQIEFPNQEAISSSLLAIYVIDHTALVSSFNSN